ncbi:MAG: hypothetical protein GWP08_16760 [Nitrospiraceae bacterium]|nr:hypothetical protein [Nitrospiraceae bacterium]
MVSQTRAKQECIIEAVRQHLEGDAAVEFVRQCGYAMSTAGVARHLRLMGGRHRVEELIAAGNPNREILAACFPDDDMSTLPAQPPTQCELFEEAKPAAGQPFLPDGDMPLYETTKLTLRIPTDLYTAIQIASRVENKSRSALIIEILTTALSKIPKLPEKDEE